MNEKQAQQAGYSFTGIYGRDKEVIKERAKQERQKGNKAVVVNVPPSKYSRGPGGMGYSVYVIESQANIEKRLAEDKARKIANLERRLAEAVKEVARLKAELAELI